MLMEHAATALGRIECREREVLGKMQLALTPTAPRAPAEGTG
jgi:hypothetical protein